MGRWVDADELVSAAQVAVRVDTITANVLTWLKRYPDMPQPVARVGQHLQTPLWVWSELAPWLVEVGVLLAVVGRIEGLGVVFHAGLAAAAGVALYHWTLIRDRDRAGCFRAFNHNTWFGAAVLVLKPNLARSALESRLTTTVLRAGVMVVRSVPEGLIWFPSAS